VLDETTVWIQVSPRGYFRHGRRYAEGATLELPVHAIGGVVDPNPPRGYIIDAAVMTRPESERDLPSFTDAALRELRRAGFHESVYDGDASGADGQVLVADVEDWLPDDVYAWLEGRGD
jgi:hypothetical protein